MLMGEPSPSLAKMKKMNPEQLQAKVDQLREESLRLTRKVQRLQEQHEPNFKKIDALTKQIQRLQALQRIARDKVEGREPAALRGDGGGGPRGRGRPGRPGRRFDRRPPRG
jgi:ribosomal protein L29